MMKTHRILPISLALLVVLLLGSFELTRRKAKYAHPKTKQIIEKMLMAHGGYQRWSDKPAINYTHTYVGPHDPSDRWLSEEHIEQGSRRVYQHWPLDTSAIIYDGQDYYGVNWKRGNPAKFTAHLAYYFGNLPFMTQDDGVVLSAPTEGKLAGDTQTYHTVKMTFESGTGQASDDYYTLYIHPDTYELRAIEYIVTYGALLDAFEFPSDVKFMGPFLKIYEKYEVVDGLKVPVRLSTRGLEGEDYGTHTYENWDFSSAFEIKWMKIPKNAVLDQSSAERKM